MKHKKLFSMLMILLLVLMIMALGIPVMANSNLIPYSVSVPTQPVTDPVTTTAQIDLVAYIHHIIITNSDSTVAQTVTFYSLSNDTNTVTTDFVVDIASTAPATTGYIEPIQIQFPIGASPYAVDELCIRKSSLASDIRVTVFYR